VASVPALPGCVSQGDSRAEALINIREAVAPYVEAAARLEAGKELVEIEAARQRDMAKVPTALSGRDEAVGFVFRRQSGSYMMLRRAEPYARIVVYDLGMRRPTVQKRRVALRQLLVVDRLFCHIKACPGLSTARRDGYECVG
jgi:predicted RNase H-like HicB family nuclease